MAKNESSKHNALEWFGGICIASTFIIGAVANYERSTEFWLVLLLLALPFFIQMIGLSVLYRKRNLADYQEREEPRVFFNFYVWTVIVSCGSVYLLWTIYAMNMFSSKPQWISWAATCCIIILGGLVAIMFWAGIKSPAPAVERNPADGLMLKIKGWLKAIYSLLEKLRGASVEEKEKGKDWIEQLRDGATKEKGVFGNYRVSPQHLVVINERIRRNRLSRARCGETGWASF